MKRTAHQEKKSYIGTTPDGERVFATWELTKDNNFSASGEYHNPAGTDFSSGGQIIDQIAADFPDNEQIQQIHTIHARYHLNDMKAGSPAQEKAIREIIEPKYQEEVEYVRHWNNNYYATVSGVKKRLEKSRYNVHQSIDYLFDQLVERIRTLYSSKPVPDSGRLFFIGSKGVELVSMGLNERRISVRLLDIDMERLKKGPLNTPDHFGFVVEHLKHIGLHRDASYLYKGKAYKYGTTWLTEELPQEVIEEINSWEEIPAPDDMTPIEAFASTLNIDIVHKGVVPAPEAWGTDQNVNHYGVEINNNGFSPSNFDYYTGLGHTKEPAETDILSALLRDALTGSNGLDNAVTELGDMGYDSPSQCLAVAKICVHQYDKLKTCGVWNRELAEMI